MTGTEARMLWLYLAETWPHYRLPVTAIEEATRERVWLDQLGPLDAETIRAVVANLADREFAPTPGQIRTEADRLIGGAQGTAPPDADEAWAEVRQNVRNPNMRDNPRWTHQAVSEAVEAMGWRDFRMSEERDEGIWRAHFLKFYENARRRWSESRGMGMAPVTVGAARHLAAIDLSADRPRGELTR